MNVHVVERNVQVNVPRNIRKLSELHRHMRNAGLEFDYAKCADQVFSDIKSIPASFKKLEECWKGSVGRVIIHITVSRPNHCIDPEEGPVKAYRFRHVDESY